MAYKKVKRLISDRKRKICELDAESIAFYRRNPCIACEELLGIKLIDSQKYILQASWNKPHVLWCCSRNFGKSFLGAIFMATDYSTSPVTNMGKLIFGIGCGFITVLIRVFGSYPEGVSFAILLMNILVPYIDKATRLKALGGKR